MKKRINITSRCIIKICYTCLIALYTLPILAQPLTTSKLIENVLRYNELELPIMSNEQNQPYFRTPLINELGIRTETDEFEQQQQYQFRIKLNSRSIRKATDKLVRTTNLMYKFRREMYLLDRIEQVNKNIVTWYFSQEELALIKQELIVLQDKKVVLSKLLPNKSSNYNNWISISSDIRELQLDSFYIENRKLQLEKLLLTGSYPTNELIINDWITIDQITQYVENLLGSKISTIYNEISAVQSEISSTKLELEKAKRNNWFDFIQLQYKRNEKLSVGSELSLGTSFTLPLKSLNKVNYNKAKLELQNNNLKIKIQSNRKERKIHALLVEIKQNIEAFALLDEKIKAQDDRSTLAKYQNINSISPLLLIDVNASIIDGDQQLLEIKNRIYHLYIDLLYESGQFSTFPLKNYLSNQLSDINYSDNK